MPENLRIFGGNFDTVNALRVTAQAGGQLLYTTGDASSALVLQTKTVTPSVNAQQVSPDEGYYGLSRVNVDAIPSSYIIPTGTLSIARNGTFNVSQYASATVNVPMVHNNQAKTVSPTSSQQIITADSGYDGLSSVTINAVSLQNKTISTQNTTQTVTADNGYNGLGTVTVNPPSLQNKTVTPGLLNSTVTADAGYNGLGTVTITPNLQVKSATPTKSTQNITPDSGYGGLSEVTVQPIPDAYITTDDATAGASDIVSGQTAYVNGEKITGTFVARRIHEGIGTPSNNQGNIGDLYVQMG